MIFTIMLLLFARLENLHRMCAKLLKQPLSLIEKFIISLKYSCMHCLHYPNRKDSCVHKDWIFHTLITL